MAYNAFAGSFNIDSSVTAGNDQSVTGVGFQPSIVMFWWGGSTASVDSVSAGDINMGFGVMAGSSSRWVLAAGSDDDAATSASFRYRNLNYCICSFLNGTTTLDGAADFGSFDADGFTLTIDNQFSTDPRISFLALGGSDLTDIYVGSDARDGDLGNHSITGIGFTPDVVICGILQSDTFPYGGAEFGLGWATGSSNQGVVSWASQGGQATSNTAGYGYNGECSGRIVATVANVSTRDAFVSFDADGFTLNQLEGTGETIQFIALAGGQYEVGDLTTRTDGNDIEENLAGSFQPVAVLFASANRALSTQDTATAHARMSIGAATATDERCAQAISDEDNLATTECAYTNQDDAVYAHVVDDAIEALMDIKSFDADGFTCVMDDTETSACWVTYLAIGAKASRCTEVTVTTTVTVVDMDC